MLETKSKSLDPEVSLYALQIVYPKECTIIPVSHTYKLMHIGDLGGMFGAL